MDNEGLRAKTLYLSLFMVQPPRFSKDEEFFDREPEGTMSSNLNRDGQYDVEVRYLYHEEEPWAQMQGPIFNSDEKLLTRIEALCEFYDTTVASRPEVIDVSFKEYTWQGWLRRHDGSIEQVWRVLEIPKSEQLRLGELLHKHFSEEYRVFVQDPNATFNYLIFGQPD